MTAVRSDVRDDQNAAVKAAREGTYDVEHRIERARRPADDDDVSLLLPVCALRETSSLDRVCLIVHSAQPRSVFGSPLPQTARIVGQRVAPGAVLLLRTAGDTARSYLRGQVVGQAG